LTSLVRESVKSETPYPIVLTGGGIKYDVEPAPIVTSQGGEVVLPKKQVFVQEQPAQTTQDISLTRTGDVASEGLTQPTQPAQGKTNNTLLYVGIGVGALLLILAIRK
jgi:hypothetical protein